MLHSPLLEVPHGFTTRAGGVSPAPFDSLNLGLSTADDPANVQENRRRVLALFGNPPQAGLCQIHGNLVHVVETAGEWKGDGLLTATPGLLLRVSVADCYPILLHDPVKGVVGALHAGWRGVVSGILPKALALMTSHWGSRPDDIRVAVGPGISGPHFQVGPEVLELFEQVELAFARPDPLHPGKYLLDLERAIRTQAQREGIRPPHYWALGRCTYADPAFFSHRRDQGQTGRMWALIMLPGP
ncbi:MAG: peptidoglycan editing factor PgeF [Meiothermus sp.]|uniref:peptidoglycan editing factor PgeF n=1 Tax=Meiothermus sp. TaxID=1955249 RepID=UPI0025E55770|nr:peptidoglycan editing factor PgeF [Meiothermus sp.]MCS7069110.1 peptidoglycan editing factor PgeF [Meiothermus sp.]